MKTVLVLLNLTQLVSGEIGGNDFNRDDVRFNASYEATSECDDALLEPENSSETAKAENISENEMEGLLNELKAITAPSKLVYDTLDSMTTQITDAWKRPISYQGGLEVYLRMSLLPDGSVNDVEIVRPSGNKQFDRSAIDAVKNASPFNEIQQFDASVFEAKFKTLTVKFRPDA